MADTETATQPGPSEKAETAAPQGRQFRRRRWFIDPSLQGQEIFYIFLISMFIGIVAVLLTSLFFLVASGAGAASHNAEADYLPKVALWLLAVAIVAVPLLVVFLSHRIAGPAYRLRACMKSLQEGDLTIRAHLRRHDHLKSVAASFNAMAEELEKRAQAEREGRTRVKETLRDVSNRARSGDESELPEILRLLEEAESLPEE